MGTVYEAQIFGLPAALGKLSMWKTRLMLTINSTILIPDQLQPGTFKNSHWWRPYKSCRMDDSNPIETILVKLKCFSPSFGVKFGNIFETITWL